MQLKKILSMGFGRVFLSTAFLTLFFTAGVHGASLDEPAVIQGMSAWFPLEGDTMDIGPNWATSEVIGATAVADRFDHSKGAMYFDGKYSYAKLHFNVKSSRRPQMSVAMWVKPEQQGCLFSNDKDGRGRSITIENRPDIKGVSIQAGKRSGGIDIPMNEWRLVVATFDDAQQRASVYVKNQNIIKKTITNTTSGEGADTVRLGMSHNYGEASKQFKGSIDNVVVWDRVLNEKEIEDILNHPELLSPAPRMNIFSELDEAKEMLRAGFYAKGAEMFSRALDKAGYQIRCLTSSVTIDSLLSDKIDVPPRFLGEIVLANYQTLTHLEKCAKPGFLMENTSQGVKVSYMFKEVPSYQAGVQLNDIIVEIDGRPFKHRDDITDYLNKKSPGDTVTLKVNRAGSNKEFSFALVEGLFNSSATANAFFRLLEYGMLAAYSGHPSLVMQASMEVRKRAKRYPADVMSYFSDEIAAVLEALAIALEQGSGPAYEKLLEQGKLQVTRHHIIPYSKYFYPLYKDPKKLAYFLGTKDPSSLKLPADMNPKKQAYINLNGDVVEPGGHIPVLNNPGSAEAPAGKSRVKGTVLD